LAVESHHADVIDPADRRGRARDLFPVWFSANLNIGNAVFGVLAVVVGNNLFWALVAVVLGNVAGGVFMALQGCRLGVPQLIQSRGQFGYYGALLPVALAAFLHLGFFVATAVIGGQAPAAAVTVASLVHGCPDLGPAGFQAGPFLTAFGLTATLFLPGLVIALRASADFHTNLNNFLSSLQLAFVPRVAVNLIDSYLVRAGAYDWIPGLLVSGAVYLGVARRGHTRQPAAPPTGVRPA
jgi:purine-cytosine permease-like protein